MQGRRGTSAQKSSKLKAINTKNSIKIVLGNCQIKILPFAGWLLLSSMVLVLYFSATIGSTSLSLASGVLMILIFLGMKLFFEVRKLPIEKFAKKRACIFVSAVAVVCSAFFPAYGTQAYCGALTGMISNIRLTSPLAGATAGIAYVLNEESSREWEQYLLARCSRLDILERIMRGKNEKKINESGGNWRNP